MEKLRRERAKTEVTLTTLHASEHMQAKLVGMNEGEMTRNIKEAAEQIEPQSAKILAARHTLYQSLKIRCATEKEQRSFVVSNGKKHSKE